MSIEIGAMAEVVEWRGAGDPPVGTKFVVEDYIPAGEVEGRDGDFYTGSSNRGWGDIDVAATCVKQAMTKEEVAARRLPTADELVNAIHGIHGDYEFDDCKREFVIDGTDLEGGGEVTVYGETDGGLRFGFTVKISGVEETDF